MLCQIRLLNLGCKRLSEVNFSRLLDYAVQNSGVSDIVCNSYDSVFVKENGTFKAAANIFSNVEDYEHVLYSYAADHGSNIDGGYMVEGAFAHRLVQDSIVGRYTIILPPVSRTPQLSMNIKSRSLKTLEDICSAGSMSVEMRDFLRACVKTRQTIAVLGATGSGKTTLVEALCQSIPNGERIGVAEDLPELSLPQPNVLYVQSTQWKPGMNENSIASLSWVVRQLQRMRVDRLIIGETRGVEFADFLTAANSGLEGCLTTLHANTPAKGLMKMTSFAMRAEGGRSLHSVNSEIASAIDIIVQLAIVDGKRVVSQITEVTNTVATSDDAKITTSDIYKYDAHLGAFNRVGNLSDSMVQSFSSRGVDVSTIFRSPLQWS